MAETHSSTNNNVYKNVALERQTQYSNYSMAHAIFQYNTKASFVNYSQNIHVNYKDYVSMYP